MLNNLRLAIQRSNGLRMFQSQMMKSGIYNLGVRRNYNQVKDLNEVMYTAALEEDQRKAKFLEYTSKVYKPSKTITFDRNGEVLLYSCDNFRHMNFHWYVTHTIFHASWILGWMPHYLYIRSLSKKMHKIYLMRGGKYCRVESMDWMGYITNSWLTIKEFHLLTEDYKSFADEEKFEFLTKEGQLKFELGVQIDNYTYYGYTQNNEVVYFMKEGTVHQPELFEQVARGYNIDTSDFEINTEDNRRWFEPTKNY